MTPARWMIGIAVGIFALRVLLHAFGADGDATIVTGIATAPAAWVLGPLVVITTLATSIAAPILLIGAALLTVTRRLFSAP